MSKRNKLTLPVVTQFSRDCHKTLLDRFHRFSINAIQERFVSNSFVIHLLERLKTWEYRNRCPHGVEVSFTILTSDKYNLAEHVNPKGIFKKARAEFPFVFLKTRRELLRWWVFLAKSDGTHLSTGIRRDESRKPLANGLLSIFNRVIWKERKTKTEL